MMKTFEMNGLGLIHYFLGMELYQEEGIFISQRIYTLDLLKKINMIECKSITTSMIANENFKKEDGAKEVDVVTYRRIIRILLYLAVTLYATSLLSRFL